MRDIVLTVFIFGALPFILRWPWVGILMWNWIGIMNPHRLTFGFAYGMPFAQIVAVATMLGVLFSREPKRFPVNAVTVTLLALIAWMSFTHLFALAPETSYDGLVKMLKIQLAVLVGLVLMQDRMRIRLLTWVVVLSIGYYGVKGGIFTLRTGGAGQVLGPAGSFIEGNTEIGLAMLMILPLMRYLQLNETRRWVRWGLGVAMVLSGVAVLGTQSRGALVGGAAMAVFFWLKSRNKLPLGIAMAIVIPVFLMFMPETWWTRMGTTFTYEEDASAMGRIDAWKFAASLAMHRPIVGGGFNVFLPETFAIYAPGVQARAGHSIYFDMLGHHGFVGLGLFVLLMISSWRAGSKIMSLTKKVPEQRWAYDLAAMCHACLIGYWTGGAFLSLSYFDVYYVIISLLVLTQLVVERELKAAAASPSSRAFDSPLPSRARALSVDRK
jgi:putative inorganic carbon (hco3(-)) transporter